MKHFLTTALLLVVASAGGVGLANVVAQTEKTSPATMVAHAGEGSE
jgi:hypothetical protein